MADSPRNIHENRMTTMKTVRQRWEAAYTDIDRLIVPGYVRLNTSVDHAGVGDRRLIHIKDNQAQKAHRIFRSGMHTGMTSKARPWNRLTTRDTAVRELDGVKDVLDTITQRMREVMAKSNIYDAFHMKYGALGAVGTAASYISGDPRYVVRNTVLVAGSYWVATDYRDRVDTLYHDIVMTAQQIIGKFQQQGDNVPRIVREAYDRGDRDMRFIVHHAMEPRTHRDADDPRSKHMPWTSNYWMDEDDDRDRLLRESGSKINRAIVSRWDKVAEDPYGYSLAMDALPDVKQLQHMQSRKLEIIDKTSKPPMSGPTSMQGKKHSLLPGAMTYNDALHQSGGFRPALDLSKYNINPLMEEIRKVKENIDDTFFVNLFMGITNMQGIQPRNEFELAERKEEKLLQLGPALDNVQTEELSPTVAGVYHYMSEAGLLPDLPEELENGVGDLSVEYTSIMAQAQKAVGVQSIERIGSYIGNWAAVKPEVLDKFDVDQSVDEYADRIGVPAKIIVSDDQVKQIRQQREQQLAQQQQLDTAAQMAPAAKQGAEAAALLSQVDDTSGDPTRLLDELGLAGVSA